MRDHLFLGAQPRPYKASHTSKPLNPFTSNGSHLKSTDPEGSSNFPAKGIFWNTPSKVETAAPSYDPTPSLHRSIVRSHHNNCTDSLQNMINITISRFFGINPSSLGASVPVGTEWSQDTSIPSIDRLPSVK